MLRRWASILPLWLAISTWTIATVQAQATATANGQTESACVLACVAKGVTASGCSSTDGACLCGSQTFATTAENCVLTTCTAADILAAEQLYQQNCGAVTASILSAGLHSTAHETSSAPGENPSQTSPAATPHKKTSIVGPVVGAVVGVVAVAAVILLLVWTSRRKKAKAAGAPSTMAPPPVATPEQDKYYPTAEAWTYQNQVHNLPAQPMYPSPPASNPGARVASWVSPSAPSVTAYSSTPPPNPLLFSGTAEPSHGYTPPPPETYHQSYPQSYTPPPIQPTGTPAPPGYRSPDRATIALPSGDSASPPVQDELSQFVAKNSDLISPELEAKLRQAHYLPSDNPADLSTEIWQSQYGVGLFELRRIQDAFNRSKVVKK